MILGSIYVTAGALVDAACRSRVLCRDLHGALLPRRRSIAADEARDGQPAGGRRQSMVYGFFALVQ